MNLRSGGVSVEFRVLVLILKDWFGSAVQSRSDRRSNDVTPPLDHLPGIFANGEWGPLISPLVTESGRLRLAHASLSSKMFANHGNFGKIK